MVEVKNTPHLAPIDAEQLAQLGLSHGLYAYRLVNRQLDRHTGRQYDDRLAALGLARHVCLPPQSARSRSALVKVQVRVISSTSVSRRMDSGKAA